MRAAVAVSAQIKRAFPCFGGRPGLGLGNHRTFTAKPVVALDSGRIDQAAIGHKNATPHLVHFLRQERGSVKMDARSSLVVVEPELVGSFARAPAGANEHLVSFAEIGALDRLVHLVNRNLVLFQCSDIQDHRVSENQSIERDLVCLLYTSPSPRDRQKSRMPSSA